MRIVSLLPSATEIVCAIGLEPQLVGVTHECDFPPTVREKPKVTRTLIPTDASSREIDELVRGRLSGGSALYSLDTEAMRKLAPDLIVTQTLCDVCAVADSEVNAFVRELRRTPRVLYLEPTGFADVLMNIGEVARAAGAAEAGNRGLRRLHERIDAVRERAHPPSRRNAQRPRVVVLEWLDPLFSCGHWTPELVQIAGGEEPLARPGERSRRVSPDELVAADPDVLMIACCGYSTERALEDAPILTRDPRVSSLRCVRERRVYVTDGSAYFSRPGPRLVDALEILAHAIDPTLHPLPPQIPAAVRL